MSRIKVYGTKSCPQCRGATQYLEQKGIEFDYVDISQDDEALKEVKAMNAMSLPVIRNGNKHCVGFNVKALEEVLKNGND